MEKSLGVFCEKRESCYESMTRRSFLSVCCDFPPRLLNAFRLSLVLGVCTKHFMENFILVHIGEI